MKKENYRIIIKYSQLTLDRLINPYYHVDKGCQFNYFELDNKIQEQLRLDDSKQVICPVCHQMGHLKLDIIYLQNGIDKEQNQCVFDIEKRSVLKMQKLNFSHFLFSKESDLFELQQLFNSQNLIPLDKKQKLNLKFIAELNLERNDQIFNIYRKNLQEQIPTLIGIANYKLILFYHFQKIKLEFDLYDQTDTKQCYKIDNNFIFKIIIKQVFHVNNFIYFIAQQDKLFQLFRGKFDQLFDESKNDSIFYVEKMPGYTLLGESRLLLIQNQLVMVGNKASIIVREENNSNVFMNNEIKIPQLSEISILDVINDQCILFINQNFLIEYDVKQIKQEDLQLIKQPKEKEIKEKQQVQEMDLLGIEKIHQIDIQGIDIQVKRQYLLQHQDYGIDFSLYHKNTLYLLNFNSLNKSKANISYFIQGRDYNFNTKKMNIINHQSYLKVKKIPTTQTTVVNVSCTLVGLTFSDSEIMFPGILVFNEKDNLIEIELI